MQQRQFAIVGGTLWGNRGAEAMVVTTIGRVREKVPDASFVILSYYPAADRRLAAPAGVKVDDATPRALVLVYFPFALLCWLFRLIGVRLPDAVLPRPVRRLRACATLFDVSGISFHDGRLAIVAYNVFCIWPALLLGVPVLHLSQAKGPFKHPLNRLAAKWFLGACRHSFARGRITAELVAPLGLPPDRWSTAADVAFSFRQGDSITHENDDKVAALHARLAALKNEGKRVVALSPSSVVLKKTSEAGIPYVDLLVAAAGHLEGLGYHLLVLPNATRAGGEGSRNNDFVVIAQMREAMARRDGGAGLAPVSWVDFDLNTDSIRTLIGECDLLVTSRFHAMVAGLALGVPTFVVGWSHKYEEVLELFGCQDDAIDFAAMRERLASELDRVLAGLQERRERIAAALPQVTASSRSQFDRLDEILG